MPVLALAGTSVPNKDAFVDHGHLLYRTIPAGDQLPSGGFEVFQRVEHQLGRAQR
jgi:hypothetical protein